MKRIALSVILLALASTAFAANSVNQVVFSIASSATTSTANLRVVPTGPKSAPRTSGDLEVVQTFLWGPNRTQNLFLTKSKTVDMSISLCAWVQVDQDTKVAVNSESAYMILPSGFNADICFK